MNDSLIPKQNKTTNSYSKLAAGAAVGLVGTYLCTILFSSQEEAPGQRHHPPRAPGPSSPLAFVGQLRSGDDKDIASYLRP